MTMKNPPHPAGVVLRQCRQALEGFWRDRRRLACATGAVLYFRYLLRVAFQHAVNHGQAHFTQGAYLVWHQHSQ